MPTKSRPAVEPASERATSREHDPVDSGADGKVRMGEGVRAAVAEDGPDVRYALPKCQLRLGDTPSGRFCVRRSARRRGVSHLRTSLMVGFLINRLLHAVAVLFGVVSVTFALLHLAGDPLAGLIPPGASPEVESQIRPPTDSTGRCRSSISISWAAPCAATLAIPGARDGPRSGPCWSGCRPRSG